MFTAMMPASSMSLTLVLALLISSVSGQVTQCASDGSPQLRFVAQLSVSGCALFVHDTGANDGPHLAVEPLMCVTESLSKVLPRFDPITQQTYVSVPVMLRDDAMLAEVQHQLRHLSPKSVKFATVSNVTVSTTASSVIQALGFVWSPDESFGFVRIGYKTPSFTCGACEIALRSSRFEFLDLVTVSAAIVLNDTSLQFKYRMLVQNHSYFDPDLYSQRFACLPKCEQLRFIRSLHLGNCTARVHQRLDMKGHFLIEPLLCHNITNMSNESIMYDYSRDMYYLKLDVVLQDDITLDAVRTQLADLSPRSITFMRLWSAQSVVASALSSRFVIGPLLVSSDWKSALVRVYCQTDEECKILRSSVVAEPVDLWHHVSWSVTSLVSDRCLLKSQTTKHMWRMHDGKAIQSFGVCEAISSSDCSGAIPCKKHHKTTDGRMFVIIQQRLTGSVSFQRNWTEYERGYGDDTDFWIGLSTIHSLSINGATLRVEMKLWNGTELHAEFAGFKVGDASTKYLMTYREMLKDRSNVIADAMHHHKDMQFSTMDRDNDGSSSRSCSGSFGKGGWWYNNCVTSNPNGLFQCMETVNNASYVYWGLPGVDQRALPREIRLMLQI